MAFQGDSIFWVEVEKIVPNPFQPRREFDEAKLRELADSIRMYGVLQPLTVTRKEVFEEDGSFRTEYELIAGERRLRASRLAGLEQVPVLIRSGEQTEQEKLELAIIENLQREDLNAVDRALAFRQLAEMFTLSHADVAKKVGRSREYVSNSIRLLALPDYMLEALKRSEISEGHARTLLMLKDRPEEQGVVYREIILKKLSVREVERIARKIATDKVRKKEWLNTDAHLIEMERAFTDTLGTRVQISKTDFGGKLTIDYFSETDLEKLLSVIKTKESIWETPEVGEPVSASPVTNETVIRTMDEMVTPLQDIVDATPLELVLDAIAGEEAMDVVHTPIPETVPSAFPQVIEHVSALKAPLEQVTAPSEQAATSVLSAHVTEVPYFQAPVVVAETTPEVAPAVPLATFETQSAVLPTPTFPPVYREVSETIMYTEPAVVLSEPIYTAQSVPLIQPETFISPVVAIEVEGSELPPASATASAPAMPVVSESEDDDLYAMRNFSL